MEVSKDQILKNLENIHLSSRAKELLLDKLIVLEIEELIGHPGYDTLSSYYGKGEGLNFIRKYVKSLVLNEGFGVGSAIAQFDSNF